jgi:hypothetical protein
LRDAISNKKIMSYKLLSKVPGDRSDATNQQANGEEYKQQNSSTSSVQSQNPIVEQRISNLSNNTDL